MNKRSFLALLLGCIPGVAILPILRPKVEMCTIEIIDNVKLDTLPDPQCLEEARQCMRFIGAKTAEDFTRAFEDLKRNRERFDESKEKQIRFRSADASFMLFL